MSIATPESTGRSPVSVISVDAIAQLDQWLPIEEMTSATSLESDFAAENHQRLTARLGSMDASKRMWLTALPLLLVDAFLLSICFFIGSSLGTYWFDLKLQFQSLECLTLVVLFVMVGRLLGLYPATGMSPVLELRQITLALILSFAMLVTADALVKSMLPGEWFSYGVAFALASLVVVCGRSIARERLAKKSWWGELAVIVGTGSQAQAIERFYVHSPQRGLRPIGFIDDVLSMREHSQDEPAIHSRYQGPMEDASWLFSKRGVRWAIVAPGGCENFDYAKAIQHASRFPRMILLPSQLTLPSLWTNAFECAGVIGIQVRDQLREPVRATFKRAVDLFIASTVALCLIPMFPLFILYAAWMQIVSPGPLIFGHQRIGQNGRRFRVWKFRTMVTDAEERLEKYLEENPSAREEWFRDEKLTSDPRIIPWIGKFMRKSSLDELPQLINVFSGEMSIVGPRPRPVDESRNSREGDLYPIYHRAKPGITGLWQVSGRNQTSYEKRVHLDSYYVRNWSPWLDFYILIRTVRTVLLAEGAY